MRPRFGIGILVIAALTSPSFAVFAQKPRSRTITVSIVNASNQPVQDLTSADLQLKENGVTRTITALKFAQPMRIIMFVDNSDPTAPATNPLRAGVTQFIDAIPPEHELMLMTISRNLQVRVQPTMDHKRMTDGAKLIFGESNAPSVLFNGLQEAFTRFARDVKDRWLIFMVVTFNGPENSNLNPKQLEQFVDALRARPVVVYGVNVTPRGPAVQTTVLTHLAESTGGAIETISIPTALPDKMKTIADRIVRDYSPLSTQYVLTYESDRSEGQGASIELAVAREGVRSSVGAGWGLR